MKRNVSFIMVIIGLLMLGTGLGLLKLIAEPEGLLRPLPYVLVGLGCGLFGHGIGEIVSRRAMKQDPGTAKQIEIDLKDERNIAIGNQAKAKAFDMMIFVFGALMLSFALMGIDLAATLLLVCAYLFVIGYGIYFRFRFDREM